MPQIPSQVTFRGLEPSTELESDIAERVEWLAQFYGGVTRCRVHIEVPHRHAEHGRAHQVRIEIAVTGGEPIVISHDASGAQPDARVAVHEAFDAARRRLEDFARQQRHTHHDPHHGRPQA